MIATNGGNPALPDRANARSGVDERTLRTFVSPLLFRPADAGPESFGAVVQVDIGGFTHAVEEFSRHGSAALEDIANLIGGCFDVLVDTIVRYGGAAHTFPGDGVIAVWEAPEDGVFDVVHSALECARNLVQNFPTARRFPLRAGVGAGALNIVTLGEPGMRRELVVSGCAMSDAAAALGKAPKGEFIVAESAHRHAPHGRLRTASPAATGTRAPVMEIAAAMNGFPAGALDPFDFVPAVVRDRLLEGLGGWTGGFRHVSTLFLEIAPDQVLSVGQLHDVYGCIQQCIAQTEGTMIQLCQDDKGLVCVMAFGVETAHEDDPDRALRTAFALQDELAAIGIPSAAGITSGRAYCGLLGGAGRLEFRLIGTAVNRAARLMAARHGVLCDEATRGLSREHTFGEPLHMRDRKGRLTALQPFRRPAVPSGLPVRFRRESDEERTCGRTVEIATAEAWLLPNPLLQASGTPVLAFLGEAGIGKTQLSSHLARRAQVEGYRVLVCQSEALAPSLALRAFRPALEQAFDLADLPAEMRRHRMVDAVVKATGSAVLAPLLDDVLDLDIGDTPATAELTGTNRADNRLALLSQLLQAAARACSERGQPMIVFMEDAHWMDAASWTLMDVLCAAPSIPMRFVVTLREAPPGLPVAHMLINGERTTLLKLGPLSEDEVGGLVAARMRALQTTPQLVAAIYRHAEGNPLFCREIVRSLAEQSLLVVTGGTARLTGNVDEIDTIAPESIEKVLQARIDRLPTAQQWILKCASVVGVQFEHTMLGAMQKQVTGDALAAALDGLVEADLITRDDEMPNRFHTFRHATVRDVAYASLLHEQRRALHVAVSLLMEADPIASRALHTIFTHWRAAGETWRALRYVEPGGNAALREGDYRIARELFQFGVTSLEGTSTHDGLARLARWSRQLGEVLVTLGRHDQALVHLEEALRLLGEVVPRNGLTGGMLILRELVRQTQVRLRPGGRTSTAENATALECAEIYEQLGYVFYASGDTLRGVHAALSMLNRSESAELSAVRARAYAAMSLTASVTPLHRYGNFFEAAARQAATELGSQSVLGWVEWIASLRAAGEARWPALFTGTISALQIARDTSEPRLAVMGNLTRAWAFRLQGELAEADQLGRTALGLAREHGNHLWEAWALLVEAECDLARQAYEGAVRSAQRALDILVEESDRTEEIRAGGILASALFAQGQESRAIRVVESTLRTMQGVDLTGFVMLEGYAGVAEVQVGRCEQARAAHGGRVDRRLQRAAHRACSLLARYARVFPVGRPRAWLLQGRFLRATGRGHAAQDALRRALQEAEALAMPRERTLAQRELTRGGRSLEGTAQGR